MAAAPDRAKTNARKAMGVLVMACALIVTALSGPGALPERGNDARAPKVRKDRRWLGGEAAARR
jgi:hypothetical protein